MTALCVLCASCQSEPQDTGRAAVSTSLQLSATDYSLSQDNSAEETLKIDWSGVDGNPSAKSVLTISAEGHPENVWTKSFAGGTSSYTMSGTALNALVIDRFKIQQDTPVRVKVKAAS